MAIEVGTFPQERAPIEYCDSLHSPCDALQPVVSVRVVSVPASSVRCVTATERTDGYGTAAV